MSYFINLSLLKRNKRFCLLFIGQCISFLGSMITTVALPYQVYHETQSTLMVGLISIFQLIPLLFTALAGGVLADRQHRRRLLLIAEFFMAIGCLLLAWNASLSHPSVWVIFLVASVMSALNGLHRPALASMLQQIVDKKDFAQMGALSSFKYSVCMIAGPAIGGLMIAHSGLVATYMLDFSSYAVSLVMIMMVGFVPLPKDIVHESALSSLRSGFKYAISRQELLGSYYVDFIAMVFGMPMALFPAIAQSYGSVKVLGMLYSAPAVGALVISFISGWTSAVKSHGKAIAWSAIFWGVAIIGFGLATNLWLALFFLALAGGFDAASGIFRQTMWNETIPQNYRGRLAGIEMISYMSGPKLGDAEAGLVAAMFGVTASVVSGGVLCVVGVALSCYYLPKFWHYRSTVE